MHGLLSIIVRIGAKWITKVVNNGAHCVRLLSLTFNYVLIDDMVVLSHQLRLKLYPVDDAHLLEKC